MKGKTAKILWLLTALAALLLAACGAAAAPEPETAVPEPTEHVHRWRGGVCGDCGAVCPHAWEKGICELCGKVCRHAWEDGVCTVCGTVCVHRWSGGSCSRCGLACRHVWQEGVCTVCACACPHERHDQETLLCAACGQEAPHSYRSGVCSRCGLRPEFLQQLKPLPASLVNPAETHGRTEIYHFPLEKGEILPGPHETVSVEDRKQRNMVVYTPPGYDPAGRYNVVILSPGAGHDARYWMERANRLGSEVGRIEGRELLDRLIEQQLIEPVIVVAVEYYLQGGHDAIALTYGRDLRERVLPFLADHYATYAALDETGTLIPAPEHFAFLGASYGAMIGWQMLPACTDLFSYWGLLSGGFTKQEQMAAEINAGLCADYPVHWLYAGDGKNAEGWEAYQHKVEYIDENCPCLEEGKNLCFIAVEDTEHNFSGWDIGLINCFRVFFLSRYDPAA